jgi:putative transcriptional regulator
LHISQAVFAAYLNASISTVQKWENGDKKPSGAAARLLSVIERKGLEVLV